MNKDQINRKADETLYSINNLKRAVPDDRLFYKIQNRVKNLNNNNREREFSYTGKFALAFAILIIINIFSFIGYKNNHNSDELKSTQNIRNNSKVINEFTEENFFETNEYYYYK